MESQLKCDDAPNKKRRLRMWFGWSVPIWETIFFWVTVAAALLSGFGIVTAFFSAIIGYKVSDEVIPSL
jgi:hypothetical protein